jgi:hypothetical protein
MYLDNKNFVRGPSSSNKFYLLFRIKISGEYSTVVIFTLYNREKRPIIYAAIKRLFYQHACISKVYTSIDIYQTESQVKTNKYFKSFNKSKQLVLLQ